VTTNSAPAPLRPRDGKLYVVRWVRADGSETRHRYFRRLDDAAKFDERLAAAGREVNIFETDTRWSEVPLT